MDGYETYARSPTSTRERDDYRSGDPYRDRRRSPAPRSRSPRRAPGGKAEHGNGHGRIASRLTTVDTPEPPLGSDRRDRRLPTRTAGRRGGDRRRSRSPQIDRYEPDRLPRDDYYRRDDYRERHRSSPQPPNIDRYVPGQDAVPAALLVNPLHDPMKLEYQVGFTWFAEWWRAEQKIKEEKEYQRTGKRPRIPREDRDAERPKIQAAYDQYKEKLQKLQAQTFVRSHKDEDWFRERYVPENRDAFRSHLMEYRRGLFAQWEQDLTSGAFDEFTLEGIYKSESNGAGGVLEKEEGETTAAAEVLNVGDLLPTRGGDMRDPLSQQPTLLIKTIAPTVTRERFEAFAKEHLGGDEGAFEHLSLSDPNPLKKCHRMGWILLKAETSSNENHKIDAATSQSQEHEDSAEAGENSLSTVKTTSDKALEMINGKTIEDPERGNFTVHCGVHRPPDAPRKKALWDLFSAPERIARDLELATRLVRKLDNELGDEIFGVAKIEQRVQSLAENGRLQTVRSSGPPKPDVDMDIEEGEEEDEGMVDDEDEVDDEELSIKKKKLDFLVEYLRRVYNFCFFCVFESDSVHELQRKCPGGHLRRPRASLTSGAKETARASAMGEAFPLKKKSDDTMKSEGDDRDAIDPESPGEEKKPAGMRPTQRNAQQLQRAFNWVKTFEEKVLQILEPENVNLRKLGGIPVEEGLEEELSKFVKQEDVSKYRCKVPDCAKLFKGVEFWRKHVEKRHEEWFEQQRQDVELVNRYVLDPAHIAPSRSDANSNGHFPMSTHLPTGTPRGFQLNQQFGMGFPMPAGMVGSTGQFNGAMSIPGFNATAGMSGGVGPLRSNGRSYGILAGNLAGARMPGPYSRDNGRARAPSMSMGGSRNFAGTVAYEGGTAAMGPREAVQGRSLRSYEDLDAQQSDAVGELNY
nr:zinc finger protein [Quercus suber]